MYRPNFCSECGERILRARWHFWTSRRFCSQCMKRFRAAWVWLPVLACAALFGLGIATGRAIRPDPPPLIVERRQSPASPAQTAPMPPSMADTKRGIAPTPAGQETTAISDSSKRPVDSAGTISTCGALTKKGTPCQRRVRGTGRCWQHQGQPAVVPLEERLLTGK